MRDLEKASRFLRKKGPGWAHLSSRSRKKMAKVSWEMQGSGGDWQQYRLEPLVVLVVAGLK